MNNKYFICTLLLLLSITTSAEVIFSDDFQDGNHNGWLIGGSGSPAVTTLYSDNYSLNLVKKKRATQNISTIGFQQVEISANVAGYLLEDNDQCIAEWSSNNGNEWVELVEISDGQDDGLTFYQNTVQSPSADNNSELKIRLRSSSSGNKDYCYFDDINISGTKIPTEPTCNYDCVNGDGNVNRSKLKYDELTTSSAHSLENFKHFEMPQNATNPTNQFQGKLSLTGTSHSGHFEELKDSYNYTNRFDSPRKHLPEFSFDFVQHGTHIIPKTRGSISSSHPHWEYILEPGRVWNENSDNGYSRISFPFALQQKNQNCTHNGVMSFLFKSNGDVSNVAYQIASETCSYYQFNMWGKLQATYTPNSNEFSQIISDYESEVENRLPTKPISTLSDAHASADPLQFGNATETAPAGVTVYGYIIDGIHYQGGCDTRYGSYPYCSVMSIPSYSTAKTTFAGLALLRLEKKYPNTFNRLVSDYIPECHADGDWRDVSFENVIDMTSGNYISPSYMIDESANHVADFFNPESHAEKISYACTKFPRKQPPGERWVYRTSDTYIAGTAMNAFLKSMEGVNADIYQDVIVKDIWSPLKLSPAIRKTRRTYDSTAQPFAGFGLTYTSDDIAKIGQFLSAGGKISGQEIFSQPEFNRAMMKDSSDRGLMAGFDLFKYNNSFWGKNIRSELENCNSDTWVPFMSGFGGLSIVIMPNDTTYYMISDGETWAWSKAASESNKIRGYCGL